MMCDLTSFLVGLFQSLRYCIPFNLISYLLFRILSYEVRFHQILMHSFQIPLQDVSFNRFSNQFIPNAALLCAI
jgi:hypothetical protein